MFALPARIALIAASLLALAGNAAAQADDGRAILLYDTYCGECHGKEAHWRDKKQARDWSALLAQVRQWQATQKLGWSESDIEAVAQYLNRRYYRFAAGR
jgi:cytochrome c553